MFFNRPSLIVSMQRYPEGAAILVRLALSVVFLWFGLNQLFDAASFMGFVPSWAYNLPVSVTTLVLFNGVFETIFGLALLLGVFVRPVAFLLALHLVGIAFSVGMGMCLSAIWDLLPPLSPSFFLVLTTGV